jgi:hypothetical protein
MSNQFLILSNPTYFVIDVNLRFTTIPLRLRLKHSRRLDRNGCIRKSIININNITSVTLDHTLNDTINLYYYKITMVNNQIFYVNQYNAFPVGLFNISYELNEDFEKVRLIYDN